jgi:hypothetical protein
LQRFNPAVCALKVADVTVGDRGAALPAYRAEGAVLEFKRVEFSEELLYGDFVKQSGQRFFQ